MTLETVRFRLQSASGIGLLVGLGIAVVLVAWQGADAVGVLLASTGWKLLLVAGFAIPNVLLATASWRLLFPPGHAPRFAVALAAHWIGTSVNVLLPVAGVGGEVVRARLLARWSSKKRDAIASVVVDKTIQVATLPLLALIGIAALFPAFEGFNRGGSDPFGIRPATLGAAIIGVALLAIVIALLVLVQRAGAFSFLASRAVRFARNRKWEGLVERASDLDGAIRSLYRPGRIAASCALRLLSRLSLAGEVWLAARLLGHPISLVDAIALKSLAMVAGGIVFAVPAGLGIQEASFVVLGALIGLPPDAALATSLATRVRELVVSVPGLLAWEWVEGRALWRRRAA
jgi:putative membrane protein